MNPTAGRKQLVVLTGLGVLFSLIFVFVGAPFLRLIRNVYGARTYWLIGGALFLGLSAVMLYPLSFLLGSCWLVVGIYSEFEQRGRANFWTATLSVLISSVFLVGGVFYSMKAMGVDIRDELKVSINSVLSQLKDPNAGESEPPKLLNGINVDADTVISQIPSIAVVILIITLAYGLILDRRTGLFFALPFEQIAGQLKLLEFRVPDFFIWIAMVSFLGTILKLNNATLALTSMNFFNVMLAVYFFQGLAVTEVVMRAFRVGPVLRFFVYFIVVFQLFFVLSAVGFIDYWIDIRRRIRKLRDKFRNQNNGEHI